MTARWPLLVLAASLVLAAVVVASAEPAEIQSRCVYRDDRPELGIPFYSKQDSEYLGACNDQGGSGEIISVMRPESVAPSPLELCWMRTRGLGRTSRAWDATATALQRCDVVGLGDVATRRAASKLASRMEGRWKSVTSERAVGRSSSRACYAVVYDAEHVEEVRAGTRGFYDDAEDGFARDPWAVTLRSETFDFTLVLVQTTSAEPGGESRDELRRVDDVFAWFQAQDPDEDDVVLMGDFGRAPDDAGWEATRARGLKLLLEGLPGTTSTAAGERELLHDQIIIDATKTPEWSGLRGVYAKASDLGLGLPEYRAKVSDHLPVWAAFWQSMPDDD